MPMISKREFHEDQVPREQMEEYARAFCRVRAQSAWVDTDADGSRVLLVRGWLDRPCAALLQMLRQDYPLDSINEAALEAYAASQFSETEPPEELLGSQRPAGEGTPVDPFSPEPNLCFPAELSDLPEPSPEPAETPESPLQASETGGLTPEKREALGGVLASLLRLSEEEALLWAIGEAASQRR